MPTYQVVTPVGVVMHPCLETLPEPGQTYTVHFRSVYGEYEDARKKGYEEGMKTGSKAADSHYIALSSLKMMTLEEISNLLHNVE